MVINKMFFSFYIKEIYLIKICLLINHSELISNVYNGFFKMVYVFYFRQFKIIIYNWSFVCQLLSEKKWTEQRIIKFLTIRLWLFPFISVELSWIDLFLFSYSLHALSYMVCTWWLIP